jgi:cold shock CspA family protein
VGGSTAPTAPTAPVAPVANAGPRRGRVASFDSARGLGEVADDNGTSLGFHATAIADGSRRIDVGATVIFTVAPGHCGRYEARSLVPIAASSPASHHRPA